MWQRLGQWIFLLWLAPAGLLPGARADSPLPSAENATSYKLVRWTTEAGLPQNRIACLQQTRDGYLWTGTWFGLARFDGVKFTLFNKGNTPAFVSDAVNALAEDSDGALWIATRNGLVKYAGGKFSRFTTADGLPNNDIWQLAISRSGGIWLQSGDRVVRCRQNKFEAVWKYSDGDRIHSFCEDADDSLSIFLNHDWVNIAENKIVKTNYDEPDAPPRFPNGARFWSGTCETPGVPLLSTPSGPMRMQRGETSRMIGNFPENQIGFLLRDHTGKIWAQSQKNSVLRFTGTNWENFSLGAMASSVICAVEDAQENLWLGTDDGLVRLQRQKVHAFTTHDGLPDDHIWSVCQSLDGTMWIGTDHGLAMMQSNHVETVKFPGADSSVSCVCPDGHVGVWVSHNKIYQLESGRILQSIKGGFVSVLYTDKSGRLWIGNNDGRVELLQDGQMQPLPNGTESLHDVRSMLEDHAGSFWFGAKSGSLTHWHENELSVFDARDGLAAGSIWSIFETEDGALWLGAEKGLVRFAHGKFFQFTTRQKMPDDTVNCVLEDNAGNFWLSTLHGIYRVERSQLNSVADGKMETVQPLIVGTADGMGTAESNGETQPAGWKAHDGRLWFPTGKGVVVIDPKDFLEKENPPPVLFESLKADGKELFDSVEAMQMPLSVGDEGVVAAKIKIAAGRGHALEFHFTACDLAAPERVRFQTRLAGVDNDWSEPTANHVANYFNLRPGDYRLEVKATDHHGIQSPPTILKFSIMPCFWQTVWFYFLCGCGIIAIIAGVQGYRLRWQRRLLGLEQQRALASERSRIARDLHDDLGTALTGMALELDVLGRDVQKDFSLVERLAKSAQHVRHLAERMREVVWVVNPRCDNLRSLADFLEDQAAWLLRAAGLKVRLEFPVEIPDLPVAANVRHQLALSVREAFTNLVRHARASEADVRLELADEKLLIRIQDNGCGFEPQSYSDKPHGLMNLKLRLEEIGGAFQCISSPGNGTTVIFTVPLSELKTVAPKL